MACCDAACSYLLFGSCCCRLSGIGLAGVLNETPRPRRSISGGGVGGKRLRFLGGSECCLRLWRPALTKLVAAEKRLSEVFRPSLASFLAACGQGQSLTRSDE